ncbi:MULTISPECIES: copper resistance protein CopC [unclassified Nonomuraea]|uniref:copper resistance CopC family protein n=1 Tax=unclassified Nonomuraea TaxID=2593643 RepID=UPI0033D154FE
MTHSLRSARRPFRAAVRAGVAVGGAVLLLLAAAPAALAHDRLKSSSPADGAKLAQVESIELEFTSRMTLPTLVLDGPAGENLPLGKPRAQGVTVKAEPAEPLEPGRYRLAWRVVSSDGHPIAGELRFTVTAPATPTASESEAAPTETPTDSPTETASASTSSTPVEAAPAASSSPVAQAEADTGSGGVPGWLWVAAAALVAGGAATVVAGRRRRAAGDAGPRS